MAKSSTTHVIEIEAGIGEPAFIPLTLGQELQPISVGKKGMWRLESPRVLDVHAFVYFDGNALFLQSADEATAAMVDGYRIGKAWTELHAPCSIELGGARLRFRSLTAPTDEPETKLATRTAPRIRQGGPDLPPPSQMTMAMDAPPVAMSPGGGPPPVPRNIPSRPPAAGQPPPLPTNRPPPPAPSIPASFPKDARPFKPGEFASRADDGDSTRIAPLDEHLAKSGLSPAALARPLTGGVLPILVPEELSTRPEGVQMRPGGSAPQLPGSMSGPYPQLSISGQNPMMPQGVMPLPQGSMPPNMMSGGYPSMPPNMSGQYPGMSPSGQYNAMSSGMNPAMGGYGAPAPEVPKEVGIGRLVAEYKAFSGPKKVLVLLMPFAMLGSVYLLFDEDPPPQAVKKQNDAGVVMEGGVASAEGGTVLATGEAGAPAQNCNMLPNATHWPAGVQCPPAGWNPKDPLPCIPAGCPPPQGTGATTAPTAPPTVPTNDPAPPEKDAGAKEPKEKDAGAKEPKERDAGAKESTSTKSKASLERQAVDLVATNKFTEAAAVYDQLAAKQQPGSSAEMTYREAARICRLKAAAPSTVP